MISLIINARMDQTYILINNLTNHHWQNNGKYRNSPVAISHFQRRDKDHILHWKEEIYHWGLSYHTSYMFKAQRRCWHLWRLELAKHKILYEVWNLWVHFRIGLCFYLHFITFFNSYQSIISKRKIKDSPSKREKQLIGDLIFFTGIIQNESISTDPDYLKTLIKRYKDYQLTNGTSHTD